MRLLNCVVSFNRYHYLVNFVRSYLEFFGRGDLVVVDSGSDDPRLIAYLETLERGTAYVVRLPRPSVNRPWNEGLNLAMNRGIELALEGDFDYVNFLQDDTQFIWRDETLLQRAEEILELRPDAGQVAYHFFKKIMAARLHGTVEIYREPAAYHLRPYSISDLGLVPVATLRRLGLRMEGDEAERNARWHRLGLRRYTLATPSLAWIPWPQTHRGRSTFGRIFPPAHEYYLKPLTEVQVSALRSRPIDRLPYQEDYCLPWGWHCLSPYWYSSPDWHKYASGVCESWRSGNPVVPHLVGVS